MKTITLELNNHADRMAIIEALRNHGYDATIHIATEYIPYKHFVQIKVKDYEVME